MRIRISALRSKSSRRILLRHHKFLGEEVVFNTGTDEHGLKIYRKALEEGKETQKYADENVAKFGKLKKIFEFGLHKFYPMTDPHHMAERKNSGGDARTAAIFTKRITG